MARDADGDYYYDAGTINEQLDDYEVYEKNGRLYINRQSADPEEAQAFDGLASVFGTFRSTSMDANDLAEGEGAVYVLDNGDTTYSVEFAFHNPDDGAVQTAALGTVGAV